MNTKYTGFVLATMVGTLFSTTTFAIPQSHASDKSVRVAGGNSCNQKSSCADKTNNAASQASHSPQKHHKGGVKCHGANACKGHSACKTATNECKGQNSCKGKGFIVTKSQKACEKKGGKAENE